MIPVHFFISAVAAGISMVIVEGMVEDLWSGKRCGACKYRQHCEAPLDTEWGSGE